MTHTIWQAILQFLHDKLRLTQIEDDNGNLTNRYKVTIDKEQSGYCPNGAGLIRCIVNDKNHTITTIW